MTGYGLDGRRSTPGKVEGIFSVQHPSRLWGLPIFVSSGESGGLFPQSLIGWDMKLTTHFQPVWNMFIPMILYDLRLLHNRIRTEG
jgi:hypothetical protein